MATYLVTHQSAHGPAYSALQGDRTILESAETKDRNQIVWRPFWCLVDPLIKPSFSTSTLLLCLLFVFCGFGWFLSQYHDLLDESLPPPIVRLDYATFVGKSQGQTETFQGIPYARPPWVSFTPNCSLDLIPTQRWQTATPQTRTSSPVHWQDFCNAAWLFMPPNAAQACPARRSVG